MTQTTDYTGQTISERYKVIRLLGRGGMGSVYLGQHTIIGKQLAIKFLNSELAQKEDLVKRFYREAQAAAAIGHKNIIDVMDVGISNQGEPFLVMEYLVGESLADLLTRAGPIELPAACGILDGVLQSLSAAHDKGIVHRDLKPDNIFLVHHENEAPTVKLIDFGISKFTASGNEPQLTRTGTMLGTPDYMSPEQARGVSDIDARSDLYSLGVIFYELLTNKLPFHGENYNELLINVLTTEPTPPTQAYPDFPQAAEPLIMRALSKDPAQRPESAAAFLQEIKKLENYDRRISRLTQLAATMGQGSVASGDLGEPVDTRGSDAIASSVLSQIAGQATPDVWTATGDVTAAPRRGKILLASAIAAAVMVGAVLFAVFGNEDPSEAPGATVGVAPPSVAPTTAPKDDTTVQITIRNLPDAATVYYKGAPVTLNPFRVDHSEAIARLRVTAPGFQPFISTLVPSEDREIELNMSREVPVAEKVPEPPAAAAPAVKKRRKSRSRSRDKSKSKKQNQLFQEGKRGTKFRDEFE